MKKQKEYENVTHEPLVSGDAETFVLDILCVPELHLLLGKNLYIFVVVKKMFHLSLQLTAY